MRQSIFVSAALLCLGGFVSSANADSMELQELPVMLRGHWIGNSISKDKGQTVNQIVPTRLATGYARQLQGAAEAVFDLEKIVATTNESGDPVILMKLSNGMVYTVTKKPEPGVFMLQTMNGNPLAERVRFGFTVRPEEGTAKVELPPMFRGVWTGKAVSQDAGKTVMEIEPIRLATAYAGEIRGQQNNVVRIEKVVAANDSGGNPGCLIKLSNGVVYGVTKKPAPGEFMLQSMTGNPLREIQRFSMTITPE